MAQLASARSWTVRDRLIAAADEELTQHGSLTGRFDAVARRAGVSRATAYRQLGSISELMTQVGLLRARKYIAGMYDVMARETTAMAKLEAAIVYGARELANEPIVLDLIARNTGTIVDPEVHQLIIDAAGSVLAEGQRSGEVRTDIGRDYIIKFLTEQSYLATRSFDRSEWAVRQRFRLFIAPAISPPSPGG